MRVVGLLGWSARDFCLWVDLARRSRRDASGTKAGPRLGIMACGGE
jgi:hypothetical protein